MLCDAMSLSWHKMPVMWCDAMSLSLSWPAPRPQVRETNRRARVEEYFRMKLQWKSLSHLHLSLVTRPFTC